VKSILGRERFRSARSIMDENTGLHKPPADVNVARSSLAAPGIST
jgi:hypothetical protein